MKKILLIFLIISCAKIFGQVENSSGQNSFDFTPQFYFDYADYKSSIEGKTLVDFYVQLPYSSIQFMREASGYKGEFSVSLVILDNDKKNILQEKIWKENITASSFDQTNSPANIFISKKTIDMIPGSYNLKISVEDFNSRKTYKMELPLKVREITGAFSYSDILLIDKIIKENNNDRVILNLSKIVNSRMKELSFYFEIYSDTTKNVLIEYRLKDIRQNSELVQMTPQNLTAGKNVVYFTMQNTSFTLGDYEISAAIKSDDWKIIGSLTKAFKSKIYGLPDSIVDIDKATAQLVYIASSDEIDLIDEAPDYNTKVNRFLEFWDKQKPAKDLEYNPVLFEYYRRVEFANKNFKHYSEGWKTDMGMIYITLGPPSNVYRQPFSMDSKPYEIWDYYDLNKSFIFIDLTGFGDYRLDNPDYSRWGGYRQ